MEQRRGEVCEANRDAFRWSEWEYLAEGGANIALVYRERNEEGGEEEEGKESEESMGSGRNRTRRRSILIDDLGCSHNKRVSLFRNKVLKLRKCHKNKLVSEDPLKFFSPVQIREYSLNLMQYWFGEALGHPGNILPIPKGILRKMSLKIDKDRPTARSNLTKINCDIKMGIIQQNFTMIWETQLELVKELLPDPRTLMGGNYYCFEVKPKCGFLPRKNGSGAGHMSVFGSNRKRQKTSKGETACGERLWENGGDGETVDLRQDICRFCLHQLLKYDKKVGKVRGNGIECDRKWIDSLSDYCPLNLFAKSEKSRVQRAIEGLISTPQNNFRMFVNGDLFDVNTHFKKLRDEKEPLEGELLGIAKDLFGSVNMNAGEFKRNFAKLLSDILLYKKWPGWTLSGTPGETGEATMGILDKLRMVQELDIFGIEGIALIWRGLTTIANGHGGSMGTEDEEDVGSIMKHIHALLESEFNACDFSSEKWKDAMASPLKRACENRDDMRGKCEYTGCVNKKEFECIQSSLVWLRQYFAKPERKLSELALYLNERIEICIKIVKMYLLSMTAKDCSLLISVLAPIGESVPMEKLRASWKEQERTGRLQGPGYRFSDNAFQIETAAPSSNSNNSADKSLRIKRADKRSYLCSFHLIDLDPKPASKILTKYIGDEENIARCAREYFESMNCTVDDFRRTVKCGGSVIRCEKKDN